VFEPAPPTPACPVDLFQDWEDDTIPRPGMFEAAISFSPPNDVESFENGVPFGTLPDILEEICEMNHLPELCVPRLGWTGVDLAGHTLSAALSAAAVQVSSVHHDLFHDGLGFPGRVHDQVPLPAVLADSVEQLGEFSGSDGVKWRFPDFESTAFALARSSFLAEQGISLTTLNEMFWLPVKDGDGRTASLVAQKLAMFLGSRGHPQPIIVLAGETFRESGFRRLVHLDIFSDEELKLLHLFFKPIRGEAEFLSRFSSSQGLGALRLLGMVWNNPQPQDLGFGRDWDTWIADRLSAWKRCVFKIVADLDSPPFRNVVFGTRGQSLQLCRVLNDEDGVVVRSVCQLTTSSAQQAALVGHSVAYVSRPLPHVARRARCSTYSLSRERLRHDMHLLSPLVT